MTFPHFVHSDRMRWAKASGELTIEKMKFVAKGRIVEDALRLTIEPVDNIGRRALWRRQPTPGTRFVAGKAALRERGHVGILGKARRAAETEHLELTALPGLGHETDTDDDHLMTSVIAGAAPR
jgi:hypothetical protein